MWKVEEMNGDLVVVYVVINELKFLSEINFIGDVIDIEVCN